jgi:hypothetical protein
VERDLKVLKVRFPNLEEGDMKEQEWRDNKLVHKNDAKVCVEERSEGVVSPWL